MKTASLLKTIAPPIIYTNARDFILAERKEIAKYCRIEVERTVKELKKNGYNIKELASSCGLSRKELMKAFKLVAAKQWIQLYSDKFRRTHWPLN